MKSAMTSCLRGALLLFPLAAAVALPASCVSNNSGGSPDAGGVSSSSGGSSSGSSSGSTSSSSSSSSGGSSSSSSSSGGGDGGGCASGFVNNGGTCYVNLQGSWSPTTDANTDAPGTGGTLGTNTTTSVSMVEAANSTGNCGCNGIHLQIPLGQTFQCSTATLAFDWATTASDSDTFNNPAVDIRFCTGPCNTYEDGGGPGFYDGRQYVGGAFAGRSNCGYEWENDAGSASLNSFPQSAVMSATNTVPLGTYVAPQSGDDCTGTFDTIDVHLQAYTCFAADTGTNTLSNLRIY